MTVQIVPSVFPRPNAGVPQDRLPRLWERKPAKIAYSALRRLTGTGRLHPWLDLTICELFQAKVSDLKTRSRLPRAYIVRLATPADAPELGEFFASPALVNRRLARGDACAVVLAGGSVCAAAWWIPGPATVTEDWDDLGCLYRIPAGVAWGYDGRGTKPGAWGCLMARLPEFLAALGVERIAASIHYNNHLSIASHLSLGFRRLGWIGCVRLLGFPLRAYRPAETSWHRLPGHLGPVDVVKGRS